MEFILSAMFLNKERDSKNTDPKLLNAARFEMFMKNKHAKIISGDLEIDPDDGDVDL
jgi:hypothetical protein